MAGQKSDVLTVSPAYSSLIKEKVLSSADLPDDAPLSSAEL